MIVYVEGTWHSIEKGLNRKATGLGEMPSEIWKTRTLDGILLRLYNAIDKQNTLEK